VDLDAMPLVPPKGTRQKGEALWSAVLGRYELEHHELVLLREIVRTVDDLDRLSDVVVKHGAITASGIVHPALTEARQLRIALATLLAALDLPADFDGDDEDQASSRRPQFRAVVRRIGEPALAPDHQSSYEPVATAARRIRRRTVRARNEHPEVIA
jgi:hypothetical protein